MKIAKILNNDMCNGSGLRTTVFVSGCTHHCEGCHNKSLWDFNVGTEFSQEIISQVIALLTEDGISRDLSILGGEPLHPDNINALTELCRRVKETLPEVQIWIWTGYELHEKIFCDIMSYIDIIIDGRFDSNKVSGEHLWRGSSNQKIYKRNEDKRARADYFTEI